MNTKLNNLYESFVVKKEGTMAMGIFDRDKNIAKKAKEELKALLSGPVVGEAGYAKLRKLVMDDQLFDDIDETLENNPNAKLNDLIKNRLGDLS